jgi:hypothetical protein
MQFGRFPAWFKLAHAFVAEIEGLRHEALRFSFSDFAIRCVNCLNGSDRWN